MNSTLRHPLTYLFVPGSRPERFTKAGGTKAHRVIIDLEDAVAPADKQVAREAIAGFLPTLPDDERGRWMIRINDVRSIFFSDDLLLLKSLPTVSVMISKAEDPEDIRTVCEGGVGREVIALMETVRGVRQSERVAQAPGVSRLAFGSLDYMFDMGLETPGLPLDLAAVELALASRLADLPPPIAGVTQSVESAEVAQESVQAKSLGFGAKLCIHPKQLEAVEAAFSPDADTRAWAERVVLAWQDAERAGAGVGALMVDGKMVDKPVLLRAQRVLGL